ncbi:MAG TPA: universal stress protein [Jiangellaceae bacterium]
MPTAEANPPIVVGVDGSDAALVALDWAAAEAAAAGWPLRMVNAYEEMPLIPVMVAVSAREAAERMLREARARLESRGFGDLSISMVTHHGFPRWVLLREAEGARALVVGREGAGRLTELVLGSTSLACATHATVPVVVVPESWRPVSRGQRIITLGVDGSPRCEAAIEFAFATAARWQARIVAVAALHLPEPVPDLDVSEDARAQTAGMLADQLSPWRAKFAGVDVTEAVAAGHPAAVIADHSADADLVVIGGRGHGVVTGMLLGSVARAVLHHVDRPIAVVHQPE